MQHTNYIGRRDGPSHYFVHLFQKLGARVERFGYSLAGEHIISHMLSLCAKFQPGLRCDKCAACKTARKADL